MQEEIETRFLEINKDELVKKLVSLGAVDKGEERLEEVIFHAADGSWMGKHKFVRLRKTKDKIKLTYKENIEQTVNSAREIEFEVLDLDKCSKFFEKVGLKENRKLEKYRHSFELGDVVIDIDRWPKIPVYMEIEGPSIESLKNFCDKLGLDWEKRFDGDAREVFRHYGYDIDKIAVITFSEFKQHLKEKSFGVVPVHKDSKNNLFFCLIRHAEGHWGFPKGHQDAGESEEETAIRELKEETGINVVNFLNNKSFIEEYGFEQDGIVHDKFVKYFLGLIPSMVSITPNNFKKEIPELKWITYEEAKKLITFPAAKQILNEVFKYLKQ